MVKTHLSQVNCEQKLRGAFCVMNCPGRENHKRIGSDLGEYLACWRNYEETSVAAQREKKEECGVGDIKDEGTHTVLTG